MPRYIDADELKEYISNLKAEGYDQKYVKGLQVAIDDFFPQIIDDIPTDDVEPVRHGRWECNQDVISYWVCSECAYYVQHEYKFCPNCGAKMSEGESDE